MELKLTKDRRRIAYHAVEKWGLALTGTANRVSGMGYPECAEMMREDADMVEGRGGASEPGLKAALGEQASLFDQGLKEGAIELADGERNILYHAIKHYRVEIEALKTKNEYHDHSTRDQSKDLRTIGGFDEDKVPVGGLLKDLWEPPRVMPDVAQPELVVDA